jgi:hypothetical protein
MTEKPLWRVAIERIDDLVEPHLLKAAHHEGFASAAGVVYQLRHGITQEVHRLSASAIHLLNLPTRSDVNRVLEHVSALERDFRKLQERMDDTTTASGNDATARP